MCIFSFVVFTILYVCFNLLNWIRKLLLHSFCIFLITSVNNFSSQVMLLPLCAAQQITHWVKFLVQSLQTSDRKHLHLLSCLLFLLSLLFLFSYFIPKVLNNVFILLTCSFFLMPLCRFIHSMFDQGLPLLPSVKHHFFAANLIQTGSK